MAVTHHSDQPASSFEEDPRYRVSVREAWVSIAYWVLFSGAMIGVAWGLGGNRDPEQIGYVFGFPAWFFWSALVTTAVFSTVVPYVMVKHLFTDIPLEAPDASTEAAEEVAR